MKVTFWAEAWEQYAWWQTNDRKMVKRINALIDDIMRNGHEGIGKPEPLRGDLSGFWSRRIDHEHRLGVSRRTGSLDRTYCITFSFNATRIKEQDG